MSERTQHSRDHRPEQYRLFVGIDVAKKFRSLLGGAICMNAVMAFMQTEVGRTVSAARTPMTTRRG